MEYKTGTLVEFRSRPWVVQQSNDENLLIIKPLGGTDAETVGIYLPLYGDQLTIKPYNFRKPSAEDLSRGYQSAARTLYDACRLSFRDIAGPFQCLGRLSFEPRPYQLVPLILALKQEKIRLLISDDVGIGKTLESLLIAKELLDRHEINRFAVVCLPHLCEQWQNEIKDKFGLDAEIIRSSTVSRLEKKLRADQNIFRDIPFQVISIDYIKQKERIGIFLEHCPDFIIVDEAHTCARPKGTNTSQQQRYNLLHRLSQNENKQIVLLTATPHSGQNEEFQSLLGLLKPEFEQYDLDTAQQREELSHYFIQRRRADISQYLGGEIVFPQRLQLDDNEDYSFAPEYRRLLNDLIDYIKEGIQSVKEAEKRKQRYVYWDLLALMRGVMSSPDAGISMLQNKIAKNEDDSLSGDGTDNSENVYTFNDTLKDMLNADDIVPEAYETATRSDKTRFKEFIASLQHIKESGADNKVKKALEIVSFALENGKSPIVFCQYIQTAEYVGNYISESLAANRKTKDVVVGTITSRLSDEERKMRIDELATHNRHVLVCTDCLSEGVNLQQGFDAIIHYDLPWNPNRVEQRNGRIDRFGQTSETVMISTMYAENNPVDNIVLNVLYKKQDEIKKKLGVYLPIADNDASLMESIMERIMTINAPTQTDFMQLSLFDSEDFFVEEQKERELQLKRIEENERLSHTYFAHNNKQMDPTRLTASLEEAKAVIGGVKDTENFVISELRSAGVNIKSDGKMCYHFAQLELPANLRHYFPVIGSSGMVKISFASPTPKGYMYIGRNHVFVEDLSRAVVNDTINGGHLAASRAMVMQTADVSVKTTILLMRVRSVIRDKKETDRELVGEEMIFFGYRGNIEKHDFLTQEESKILFLAAQASGNIDVLSQKAIFNAELQWSRDEAGLRKHTDDVAMERANHLVDAFTQYRTYLNAAEYQVVEPVLPMDMIAAYIFLPKA
ncbi:MAG: DEAD/DEAH box helicase [Bacteroidales bacterium]|nr:DEAD/DEAH box helicase [Bacteroidales bacterium]